MPAIPEMRFLAHCLPTSNPQNDLDPDTSSLNWGTLLDLARWHGITPLVAHRLAASGLLQPDSDVPPFVITELAAVRDQQLVRSLTSVSALIQLQYAFEASGITVLPWKGPSAGLLLYGSAFLREAVDLDFLFLERDLPRIQEITSRLGYYGQNLTTDKDHYEFEHQHEYSFYRSRDKVLLEFHSQIMTSRFSAWQDSDTYIDRANVSLPIAGTHLHLQCPEDLLVSLCVHAVKHNWDRLKWSCDVAMFLRLYADKIDWTKYLADLARTRKHSVVLLGLGIAAGVFNLQLSPEVTRALHRAPHLESLAAQLTVQLMSGSTEPVSRRQSSELVALLCPRLYDRFVYVLSPIVRLEYEDLRIRQEDSPLFLLNYPYRFWRLLRRHGLPRLLSMTAMYIRSVR
jgi:hypothetical protein